MLDENFGQAYVDDCEDWRNKYENAKPYFVRLCEVCGRDVMTDDEMFWCTGCDYSEEA